MSLFVSSVIFMSFDKICDNFFCLSVLYFVIFTSDIFIIVLVGFLKSFLFLTDDC